MQSLDSERNLERNAMNNAEEFIKRLEQLKHEVNQRLDGLIMCKYGDVKLSFDDIDQKIADCIDALDRLQASIDRMKSF